jgi:predicted DNA-binding protein with PD1-like motif
MKLHTLRLTPGQDLRAEIIAYVTDNKIKAGFVVTCAGGLTQAVLRMAGAEPGAMDVREYKERMEIVSLGGTVWPGGAHLHMSVSTTAGTVIGGHLKDGSLVFPTAEIVLGEDEEHAYSRTFDPETGFDELVVR